MTWGWRAVGTAGEGMAVIEETEALEEEAVLRGGEGIMVGEVVGGEIGTGRGGVGISCTMVLVGWLWAWEFLEFIALTRFSALSFSFFFLFLHGFCIRCRGVIAFKLVSCFSPHFFSFTRDE